MNLAEVTCITHGGVLFFGFVIIAFFQVHNKLWACHCSEMQFVRYKNTLAGMSLLRNTFLHTKQAPAGSEIHLLGTNKNCGHVTAQQCNFRYKKNNCGHVTAQKCN